MPSVQCFARQNNKKKDCVRAESQNYKINRRLQRSQLYLFFDRPGFVTCLRGNQMLAQSR